MALKQQHKTVEMATSNTTMGWKCDSDREYGQYNSKIPTVFPVPNVNRNETVILVLNYEKSGIQSVESWFNEPLYNKVFKV